MLTKFRNSRRLQCVAVLLAGMLLVGVAYVPLLREVAAFLIIEDSLQPAAAIVALGGDPPFREMEAAKLYRAGWASKVIVVPGALWEEQQALSELGISVPEGWEISREVLLKKGVPSSAIILPKGRAEGTLEELQLAFNTIGPVTQPVILVSSKFHTRRVSLTWNYVSRGESGSIVRAAEGDPFDPVRWWRERRFILSVVREYLGLINYYAGFPVGP